MSDQLEAILLLVCELSDEQESVFMTALKQLVDTGFFEKEIEGVLVSGHHQLARDCLIRHLLGNADRLRVGKTCLRAGQDSLAARFGVHR